MARTRELALPRRSQPQGAVCVDWDSALASDLLSITVGRSTVIPGGLIETMSPPSGVVVAAGPGGIGPMFSGGGQTVWLPNVQTMAAGDPFTLEVLCAFTSVPPLAGVYGTPKIGGTEGYARAIMAFGGPTNRNILFWGQNRDVASGVDWRTDGSLQHVFVVRKGSVIRFYRDGQQIAQGTTPSLDASFSELSLGDRSYGWNSSPTGTIFKAATYRRDLSAGEIAHLTANPWAVLRPVSRRVWLPEAAQSGVPDITALLAESILSDRVNYRATLNYA